MTKETDLVFPGDFITNEEVFLPGEGTYAEDGKVMAAGIGTVVKDMDKREVSLKTMIKTPLNFRKGDTAIGIVAKARDSMAFIDLIPSANGKHRLMPSDASAVLRVSEIKKSYVKSLTDEIKTGDIVRVKILDVSPNNITLSLKGDRFGVIKAFCSRCRHPLKKEGKWLICPQCNWRDKRKIAKDYRQGRC